MNLSVFSTPAFKAAGGKLCKTAARPFFAGFSRWHSSSSGREK
jgi:hypothetical protein